MREEKIDILIIDWQLKTLDGIDLAVHLRQSLDSPNRMIPIIMLTAHNDRVDIEKARDAGISEYLVKPFSSKTLLERLYAVVEEPRSFILCKSFVGPDRRRFSSFTLPPNPDSERVYIERKPPVVVPREELKTLVIDDTPRMIMPDYTLKKKIGLDVPTELLVNPLAGAQTEAEVKKVQDDFLNTIIRDVENMEAAYRLLITSPDNARTLVRNIQDAAESIKARAGIFGYIRATEVASQLYNFCRRYYDKDNKYHLVILEKHIQTITAIFANRITGDGGEVGKALLQDLAKLIQKYLNRKD
jgi:CheY-like chemotaxis protein